MNVCAFAEAAGKPGGSPPGFLPSNFAEIKVST
jgi:hypothetical protein